MMKKNTKIVLTVLLVGGLSGCTALLSDASLKKMHRGMDTNHDGYVEYSEYLKTTSKKEIAQDAKKKGMTQNEYLQWEFGQADVNKDGKVSVKEYITLARK